MEWTVGISRDGSKLLVSSDRIPGGTLNLYYSAKQSDGSWGPLIDFGPGVNTWYDEEHASFSPGNNRVFFYRTGQRSGDVWVSQLQDSVWPPATYLPEPVTTLEWMEGDPCLGPDGSTLYFLSDRNSPVGRQMYVTEDTTISAVGAKPAPLPRYVKPALFARVVGQNLVLTLVGGQQTGRFSLKIFDLIGRVIEQTALDMYAQNGAISGSIRLDLLPSGTYIARVQYRDTAFASKFTIMR
jgi:hypothetical protein